MILFKKLFFSWTLIGHPIANTHFITHVQFKITFKIQKKPTPLGTFTHKLCNLKVNQVNTKKEGERDFTYNMHLITKY